MLANALAKNTALTGLHIKGNELGNEGVKALCDAFRTRQARVVALDFGNNRRVAGLLALLASRALIHRRGSKRLSHLGDCISGCQPMASVFGLYVAQFLCGSRITMHAGCLIRLARLASAHALLTLHTAVSSCAAYAERCGQYGVLMACCQRPSGLRLVICLRRGAATVYP